MDLVDAQVSDDAWLAVHEPGLLRLPQEGACRPSVPPARCLQCRRALDLAMKVGEDTSAL